MLPGVAAPPKVPFRIVSDPNYCDGWLSDYALIAQKEQKGRSKEPLIIWP